MKTSFLKLFKKVVILSLTAFTTLSFYHFGQGPIAFLDHPEAKVREITIMTPADFKKSKGVTVQTKQAYEIAGFNMVQVAKNSDPVETSNWGGNFGQRSMKLIESAKSGDVYYFENIMAKLPTMLSEDEWVKLNSFVVRIE